MTQSARLDALTSLRFLAATVVVIHHSVGSFGIGPGVHKYIPVGGVAVSFFFLLSGFILTYVYGSLDGRKAVGHFMLARIGRIWPLHIATLLLVVLLFSSDSWIPGKGGPHSIIAATNVLMAHAWIPKWNYFFSFNWLSWSISTEFGFYLCFPLLIYAWKRTWHLKLLFTFSILVGLFICCNYYQLPAGAKGGIGYFGLVHINPLGRLFEFTFGMAVALIYGNCSKRYQPGIIIGSVLELICLGMVVLTFSAVPFLSGISKSIGPAALHWAETGGFYCPVFGLLILSMALQKGLISRLLSWKPFVVSGEISFAVYLLHQILIRVYRLRIEAFDNVPDWLGYAYFWVFLIISSHLSWRLIERPCRKLIVGLKGRSFKRGPSPAGAAHKRRFGSFLRYLHIKTYFEPPISREGKILAFEAILLVALLVPICWIML